MVKNLGLTIYGNGETPDLRNEKKVEEKCSG